jgi:hypothetical protein
MEAIMDKIKNPYKTTMMTGTTMFIMLAVSPNFLPGSSDILTPKMLFLLAN